ncbi:Gaa1-domain-containing protein [Ramaria rubella]|nr:Gaa1-domain-containing protein [Ramaria rubella]
MSPRLLNSIVARWRGRTDGAQHSDQAEAQTLSKKQRRRKALMSILYHSLPRIRIFLFIIGYGWMLLLPSLWIGRGIYIDENALQPGQVNTYWSWSDVHSADVYLERLEQLRNQNASSIEMALSLKSVFLDLGIPAATQTYSFKTGTKPLDGANAYAVLSAPRTAGTEAIVIAASWSSLNGGPNLRGIATVLSLAEFLKRYSLWAKDIIFVISDGYFDGMQAWLGAYHGLDQTNLVAERLSLHSGVIWTALAIDYPGHSFSHLGVFYEGLNGRLPNQDLMNSFNVISTHTGGVPVVLYDHLDEQVDLIVPHWLPLALRNDANIREYVKRARNIIKHVGYQTFGRASGIHGLFHQFRIDAITLFAVPAAGPHGFHALGRIIESTLRTMNNLLERLHASFFFYILTGPGTFLKIGEYLPTAVIISVAMMFGGLHIWVDAGWVEQFESPVEKDKDTATVVTAPKWKTRRRNVLTPLAIMLATHTIGGVTFFIATSSWFMSREGITTSYLPIIPFSIIATSVLSALLTSDSPSIPRHDNSAPGPLSMLLKSFNLCLASTVISITSVLNFSLAACLAILLGIPLSISSPTKSPFLKVFKNISYLCLLSPVWWILLTRPKSQSVWDWQVLGIWFTPFVCLVYLPLVLQAMVICMLGS